MMPAIQVGLLVLVVTAPAFIFFSQKGPGAMHAPWLISLVAGLVVGGLSQLADFVRLVASAIYSCLKIYSYLWLFSSSHWCIRCKY